MYVLHNFTAPATRAGHKAKHGMLQRKINELLISSLFNNPEAAL
jgi:hypothetical protein